MPQAVVPADVRCPGMSPVATHRVGGSSMGRERIFSSWVLGFDDIMAATMSEDMTMCRDGFLLLANIRYFFPIIKKMVHK